MGWRWPLASGAADCRRRFKGQGWSSRVVGWAIEHGKWEEGVRVRGREKGRRRGRPGSTAALGKVR